MANGLGLGWGWGCQDFFWAAPGLPTKKIDKISKKYKLNIYYFQNPYSVITHSKSIHQRQWVATKSTTYNLGRDFQTEPTPWGSGLCCWSYINEKINLIT